MKHFELQDGTDNYSGEECAMCVQTAEPYAEPTNDVDTKMAFSKLQNGKATGHDQIPAASIKEGGKELKNVIYELVSKIWEEEITPHEWKCGIMCPIHKDKDVTT
jgi:hypothetical protein